MKTGDYKSAFGHLGRAVGVVFPAALAAGCGSKSKYADATQTIGGTVSGVVGTLVLQLNGGNDLAITADGAFTFATGVVREGGYAVTIKTPPVGQVCTVANGAGTIAASNITNVAVVCGTAQYTIGGAVTGLKVGGTLVLQNNSGDDVTVSADGDFTFPALLPHNGTYNVTVATHPAGQQCNVANGGGTAAANVPNIVVTCVSFWTVGGTVSGLIGTVVLQNNGGDDFSRSASGAFTFPTTIANGSDYNVTVKTQPVGQLCTVANGSGTIAANVANVTVTCVSYFNLGGTVSGLIGTVVLQNNGGDDLSISAIGSFTFATKIANGGTYAVTVKTQPTGQNCTVGSGAGTVSGANVTNVSVACSVVPPIGPTLILNFGIKTFKFSWVAVPNATHYKLLENPDGVSGFTQVGSDIPSGTTNYDHVVALYQRVNASYLLEACNTAGCTDSAVLGIAGNNLVQAIGYFKASNTAANDSYGRSLAISADGSTLAVGAPNEGSNSGAVYVFTRAGGSWSQQVYVKASNTEAADAFGWSVALSSDGATLAVGSPNEDSNATGLNGAGTDNSAANSGAVYVFTRAGSTWSQQAYVKASNTGADDQFGYSLALSADGNTLAAGAIWEDSNATGIGADQESNSASDSGAVYVFTRTGSNWSQQVYVKASNSEGGDGFGWSLAFSADGNTLAVGAPFEDSNGVGGDQNDNSATNSGAAYVFTRSGAIWSQQTYAKASNAGANDLFGRAIALSADGSTLAVGAPFEDSNATRIDGNQSDNTAEDSGAVYAFARTGTTWSQQAYAKASNTGANDVFGWSLSLSSDGNALAVGAVREASNANGVNGNQNNNTEVESGAAYVFARSVGIWSQKTYLKASNPQAGDTFGVSLALSGDGNTLAVGATGEDSNATGIGGSQGSNAAADSGAAYLY